MTPVSGQIPEGYSRHFRTSPLTDPREPLYSKAANGAILLALCETLGERNKERPSGLVTISLALDFLGSGKIDQWLEFVPRVLRAGGSLGFVDCLVRVDDQPVARGNATFRIFRAGED
jgi:acyl-coenzyme A thioesterase PaaI-like protein